MPENENALKQALAENSQFKAEKADMLQKQSSDEFSNKMKLTERFIMAYLLLCVVVGVPVLNLFIISGDLKTLVSCLLFLVVIYETTVLLKLWYVVAGTKLSVLKEVKLLRLEVSQLSLAAGRSEDSAMPSEKYEPAKGLSKTERRVWLAAIIVVAFILGGLSGGGLAWFSLESSELDADTLVTLNDDGSAVSTTDIVQTRFGISAAVANNLGISSPSSFSFYAPPSRKISWFDSQGRKLHYTTTQQGTHTCYDVERPKRNASDGRIAYTYLTEIPDAAKKSDRVWTFANDTCYGCKKNRFNTTILLPEGAELVSVEPKPVLEFTTNGRRAVRLQGVRGQNEKFKYELRYRLPEKADVGKTQ